MTDLEPYREKRGWTRADDATLRQLWAEKLDRGVIGLRMGRSRNSIIGRAWRLKLITRHLPHSSRRGMPPLPPQLPKLKLSAPPPKQPLPKPYSGRRLAGGCQWISGEPTRDDSCKCLRPRHGNSAWCEDHYARVWQKVMKQEAA